MNFKDQYKNDYDKIKADDKFKADLVAKLSEEQGKKSKKNIYVFSGTIAAAALLAIVIGVGIGNKNVRQNTSKGNEGSTMDIMVEQNESSSAVDVNYDNWYKDAKTDEEIYQVFSKLIKDGKLEKLYCSTEEKFSSKDIMDSKGAENLASKLADAKICDEEMSDNVLNYMAVFEDGEIVKFSISDEKYVILKDIEVVFQIK